ncbi:MAG: fumarylacetoacetase [Gemmatimonadales bacterium]|nr:fumarylacetoacetase [Gemmatimonadales bacterium]
MTPLDATHDPARTSWVPGADAHPDFPIQNLPLGVFRERHGRRLPRGGIAIGDQILDLNACLRDGLVDGEAAAAAEVADRPSLNDFLALGAAARRALRVAASELLRRGGPGEAAHRTRPLLVPQADVEMLLPATIGDYSDFYASRHHAGNVGRMLRPDNPLLPNYHWVPIGYHGRASSVVPSGTPVVRPWGQVKDDAAPVPVFQPSRRLDYELEVGLWIGPPNAPGEPIPIAEAGDHLAGICLLNDWSARDVQAWEYQPLGPFLSKSFCTSISPWIVTMEALAPFRAPLHPRPDGDPAPLPHLHDDADAATGAFALTLDVWLRSRGMVERGDHAVLVSRSSLRDLHWTPAQLVAHHASNGCPLRPGDLLGTGTVSGPAPDARGCLLERTWRGSEPFALPDGTVRRFLEDGDEVTLRGRLAREGAVPIGLGACTGIVLAAHA